MLAAAFRPALKSQARMVTEQGINILREAMYYEKIEGGSVECRLCPHFCKIKDGKAGICRQRKNDSGTLHAMNYARITSSSMDPIEKKPLYHFQPGTWILSLGTVGCNFKCDFCQNFEISQGDPYTSTLDPAGAVEMAKANDSPGIAFTYNEPTIWFEFVLETAKLAREAGLISVLVTNGYINPEPQAELLPYVDGVNQDIKSIREDFYKDRCGGHVEPVLEAAKRYKEATLLEVTNLIIPGRNDSEEDITGLRDWIADNLGTDTPVHISAYFPRYKLKAKPTGKKTMEQAFEIMTKRMKYVYVGNMISADGANTQCASCKAELVSRRGYGIKVTGLDGNKCSACGALNNIKA